jgi:ATPase family associated with various cellular activities (AAA)
MLELALRAELPMIRVKCDDPIHLESILQAVAGGPVQYVEKISTQTLYAKVSAFWTDVEDMATTENFQILESKGKSLIFVNTKVNDLMFDAGQLMPLQHMVEAKIEELGGSESLLPVVKGMSIKQIQNLLALTSAKYGDLNPRHCREMRIALGQTIQGLYPIETELGYYEPLKELEDWLAVNGPYFLSDSIPEVLIPRGLLFEGAPGTGKTMAARRIALALQVPLYRLDVSTTLNRYIGESEARLAQSFQMLDREEPCVVLFDEVEKLFVTDSDNGVIDRLLSQLLWWLQEHRTRVLTVMTTNDMSKLPPELYRPGRIDAVIKVPLLEPKEATMFAKRLLTEIMQPEKPTLKQQAAFNFTSVTGVGKFSHAQVAATVFDAIKTHKWIAIDKPK